MVGVIYGGSGSPFTLPTDLRPPYKRVLSVAFGNGEEKVVVQTNGTFTLSGGGEYSLEGTFSL